MRRLPQELALRRNTTSDLLKRSTLESHREEPKHNLDTRNSLSDRSSFIFLTVFIIAVFLFTQFLFNPIRHVHHGFRLVKQLWGDRFNPATTLAEDQDGIPTSISRVIVQPYGPAHSFTVPCVLTYYEDILPDKHTRLYLVTSGIMMKISRRNLRAVACQVGEDIYPSSVFTWDILHCDIPRPLRRGERLAAVLAWDNHLKRAVEGPVKLVTGITAEIYPGDIEKLSDSAVLHGKLAATNRDELRVARSDVHVGPSDNFVAKDAKHLPRYRLCLMTMVAPNSHMLKDWADYHRRIGVDQVYIFDNGAERDLRKMFEDRADVEIVSWAYHKSQVQAVSTFMFAARSRCERSMLDDSDEYPMFGLGEGTSWRNGDPPLIRYAKKVAKKGYLHYKLLHVVMVNSGFLHRPQGEVPTNFIHRRKEQTFRNGKSVCYMDLEWQSGAVHFCGVINGTKPEIYTLDIHNWGEMKMTPDDPDDPPFLIHYRCRSWEENIEKWDAGRPSGKGVADLKAGTLSMDEPDEKYMAVDDSLEYTHFRDKIYARVLKDGTLHEQTIVQTREDGRRCERLYRVYNSKRDLVHERCN